MRLLTVLLGLAAVFNAVNAKITVHLNCHTHDDVGWLKTVDQYYSGLNKQIDSSVVQYILHSVINELEKNPDRKFMYVEQAFFQRYWNQQNEERRDLIRKLVKNGQLEFVNGGWCMHDEAATHWIDMIDQTTLGHRFITDQFGVVPTVTWQIDPFGHSATQASLLGSNAGFQAFFTARIDYADFRQRKQTNSTEWIWRSSPSFGQSNQMFAGIFQWADQHLYGPPDPFNYEMYSTDPAVQADPRLTDYNLDDLVAQFNQVALQQATFNVGEHIMWNMGFDFNHENSHEWYKQLDIIIEAVRKNGTVNVQYSTPSLYVKAKNEESAKQSTEWPVKTDDGFPYANDEHSYWTGYFTSRPALKRYVRVASAYLQMFRQIEMWVGGSQSMSPINHLTKQSINQSINADQSATEMLWQNVAVAQHHDGVSGTSKQHVAYDYAQRISTGWNIAEQSLLPAFMQAITVGQSNGQSNDQSLVTCPLTNVSICATQSFKQSVVIVYNSLGHTRNERVVLTLPDDSTQYEVVDSEGNAAKYAALPVFRTQATGADSAKYEMSFMAKVPPMGWNTYYLVPSSDQSSKKSVKQPSNVDCSGNPVLKNDQIAIYFDESCQVSGWSYEGQSIIPFTINFAYYQAYQSEKQQNSGAYIFRPAQQYSIPIVNMSASLEMIDEGNVHEARLTLNDWISMTIRLIDGQSNIEVDWTVGPVPIDDGIGKEVIIQYNSSALATKAQGDSSVAWYTDSNGREFQKRIRNYRQSWDFKSTEPISQNYVPVNAAAYVNSSDSLFSVVVDRSQGVASQADGSIEFLIHRRLLFDDNRGVGEPMNETGAIINCDSGNSNCPWGIQRLGKPLVIRGTHYLRFDQSKSKDLSPVRALQNSVYSPLTALVGELTTSVDEYAKNHVISQSFLTKDLPAEIEVSHTHLWRDESFLIRLMHNFGVGDDDINVHNVDIDLSTAFMLPVNVVNELSITANQKRSDVQELKWNTQSDAGTEREVAREAEIRDTTVTIAPAEVRTFQLAWNI